MRHAAAFAGEPARLFDIHPAVSAVSPRQEDCIRARGVRPADGGLRPRAAARASTARSRRASATRRSTMRSRPTRRPRWWRRSRRSAGISTAPRAARSTSACRSGSRRERIAFGNTIKRAADIAHAHAVGVEQFAADAEEELDKIARHAPGARVILRMLVEASEADWPLSRKFGCSRARGAAADGPRPGARARRRRHLVPRRQPDARAGDVGAARSTRRWRSGSEAAAAGHALAHPQHRRRVPGLLRPAAAGDRGVCGRR